MDIVFDLLLFIHLVALVVGAATNVAMPLIGRQMAGNAPDARGRSAPSDGRSPIRGSRLPSWSSAASRCLGPLWRCRGRQRLVLGQDGAGRRCDHPGDCRGHCGPGSDQSPVFGVATRLLLLGIVFTAVFAFN